MEKTTIWALFDSGNGCYTKGADGLNRSGGANIDIYPIGLDVENKNNHFINLDLANYGRLFNNDELFEKLDKLPRPDIILASPPCESWSMACAMKNGNVSWKREDLSDSLFVPQKVASPFTIRSRTDFDDYQYNFESSFLKRINGELTAFNLIEIIKHYQPRVYVVENPANSKIWEYIETILGFELSYDNLTRYNNYDDYPLQKPTKFASNIYLDLDRSRRPGRIPLANFSKSYNERSNIPDSLVQLIIRRCLTALESEVICRDIV